MHEEEDNTPQGLTVADSLEKTIKESITENRIRLDKKCKQIREEILI
jgi:hypothetical protein